jgi:hypothetical protein
MKWVISERKSSSYTFKINLGIFPELISKNSKMEGTLRMMQHSGVLVQTLLPWTIHKYYIFWVGTCSLKYSACKAHAPYFHLWSARLCRIFPPYLINDKICEKMLLDITCVFYFLYIICLKHFSLQEELSEIWP